MIKLEQYGIRDTPLSWFKSHLSNRQQCVKVKSKSTSKTKFIICGVPQGSVLGPSPFLLYINDIHVTAPKLSFNLFADDACLFYSSKDIRHP